MKNLINQAIIDLKENNVYDIATTGHLLDKYTQLYERISTDVFGVCPTCYEIPTRESYCNCKIKLDASGNEMTRAELLVFIELFDEVYNCTERLPISNIFRAKVILDEPTIHRLHNGKDFILVNVKLDNGPAQGKNVKAKLIVLESLEITKKAIEVGNTIFVNHRLKESNKNESKYLHYFDINPYELCYLDSEDLKGFAPIFEELTNESDIFSENLLKSQKENSYFQSIQGTWFNDELEYTFDDINVSFNFKKSNDAYKGVFIINDNKFSLKYFKDYTKRSLEWHAIIEKADKNELVLVDTSNEIGRREVFRKKAVDQKLESNPKVETKADEERLKPVIEQNDYLLIHLSFYIICMNILICIFFNAYYNGRYSQIVSWCKNLFNIVSIPYFMFIMNLGTIRLEKFFNKNKFCSKNSIIVHLIILTVMFGVIHYFVVLFVILMVLTFTLIVRKENSSGNWKFKQTIFFHFFSKNFNKEKIPLYLSCVLLLLAIAPMPYGYYQFLRIAITIVAGILAYNSFLAKQKTWFYIFIPMVILYNPILPIHLAKEIWLPINLLTFIVFLVYIFFKKDEKKSSQNSQNNI